MYGYKAVRRPEPAPRVAGPSAPRPSIPFWLKQGGEPSYTWRTPQLNSKTNNALFVTRLKHIDLKSHLTQSHPQAMPGARPLLARRRLPRQLVLRRAAADRPVHVPLRGGERVVRVARRVAHRRRDRLYEGARVAAGSRPKTSAYL